LRSKKELPTLGHTRTYLSREKTSKQRQHNQKQKIQSKLRKGLQKNSRTGLQEEKEKPNQNMSKYSEIFMRAL
jgi:hypothetical protein